MMESRTLRDFITFKNGKKRPEGVGAYPVYGGNGILGYADSFNYEDCLVIGRVGAYCGSVYHECGKCWVPDNAIAALPKAGVHIGFFYLLKSQNLNTRHIGIGQPLLIQDILNRIECNIPDRETQARIASTLQSF